MKISLLHKQEADNWTTLSSDVDEIFKTENVIEVRMISHFKSIYRHDANFRIQLPNP